MYWRRRLDDLRRRGDLSDRELDVKNERDSGRQKLARVERVRHQTDPPQVECADSNLNRFL